MSCRMWASAFFGLFCAFSHFAKDALGKILYDGVEQIARDIDFVAADGGTG